MVCKRNVLNFKSLFASVWASENSIYSANVMLFHRMFRLTARKKNITPMWVFWRVKLFLNKSQKCSRAAKNCKPCMKCHKTCAHYIYYIYYISWPPETGDFKLQKWQKNVIFVLSMITKRLKKHTENLRYYLLAYGVKN